MRKLPLVLVLLITCLVYLRVVAAPPLSWDDTSNIFNNPYFRLGYWWGVWTEPYFGLYVPITSTVWAALLHLGGGQAWPFHVLNLLLHLANTVLVFLLLRSLLARRGGGVPWLPVLGAAIFALHPLQVQAVAWISGGRDLLAAFFALAAVLVYFYRDRGYFAALGLFALALLSKPNVVVLPAVIFLIEWGLSLRPWQASAKRLAPWLGLSAAAIVLTQMGQGPHFTNTMAWYARPYLMLENYGFYITKTFWPHPLSGNYDATPARMIAQEFAVVAISLIALAIWQVGRRVRRAWLPALWALLLLPVSGLVPFAYENIGGVADHYNYLPLAVVAACVMLVIRRWPPLQIVVGFGVVLLALLTWQRLPVWQSDAAFFTDMARTSPDSYNTAIGMSVVECGSEGHYDEGLKWVDKALKLQPNDMLARANEAFCLDHAGRTVEVVKLAPVLAQLDRPSMAANQPTAYSSFLTTLGKAFIETHQYAQGFTYLCEAYRTLPSDADHASNLTKAAALLQQAGFQADCASQTP